MTQRLLDFRSDTVTRPTPGMRQAMAAAEVGDDVFGEDPSVLRLEARIAELLGKEAAIYVPSGTMSNQIAVRAHCRPGDEIVCEANCHIHCYEQAGAAQLSGVATRAIEGEHGVIHVEQLQGVVRPDNPHFPATRLVCLENTHNRGGGRVLPLATVEAVCRWARQHGLATHLDGARLFNAVVATGIPASDWAAHFDTVSVCFSKGLGAPVGSALCGQHDLIHQAIRHRKVLGGGMRQAGVIAAAALYALEHHIERLADDHASARILAAAVNGIEGLALSPETVDTNLVCFNVDPLIGPAAELVNRWADEGVLALAIGPQRIRAVTHLDVSIDDAREAGASLSRAVAAQRAGQCGAAAGRATVYS